jgi:hypothetical protein
MAAIHSFVQLASTNALTIASIIDRLGSSIEDVPYDHNAPFNLTHTADTTYIIKMNNLFNLPLDSDTRYENSLDPLDQILQPDYELPSESTSADPFGDEEIEKLFQPPKPGPIAFPTQRSLPSLRPNPRPSLKALDQPKRRNLRKSVTWKDEASPGSSLTSTSYFRNPPTRRETLRAMNLPPAVIDALQIPIRLDGRPQPIEEICEAASKIGDGLPDRSTMFCIRAMLKRDSLDDQRAFFRFVGWCFWCTSCGLSWPAVDYKGVKFFLDEDGMDPDKRLQSGPCILCKGCFGA